MVLLNGNVIFMATFAVALNTVVKGANPVFVTVNVFWITNAPLEL